MPEAATRPVAVRAGKRLLYAGGLYRRRLVRRPFPGIAVLAYHGVCANDTPDNAVAFRSLHVTERRLAEHCRTLATHCSPISLSQWRRARATGAALPPRAVLVTFDDGYRSVLTRALPVLERFGIPALVFACAEPIERQERFWFDALAARKGEQAVEAAKQLPFAQWHALLRDVRMDVTPDDPHAPLSIDELRRLAAHPLIEIGNHTARHVVLARAPLDDQRCEIEQGADRLAQWLGRSIDAFAYPNGRPDVDFTAETAALVAQSGATDGFAVRPGFASTAVSFEHPRFLMLDAVSDAELAHRLAWGWRTDGDAGQA